MTQTRFRDKYAMLIPGRALGYASDDESPEGKGGFRNAVSNWEQTGDGALHLSIEEAQKWDENFYQPRVGARAFVERLQEPGKLANGEAITYARGLVVENYRGLSRVQHGGNWVGYNAMMMRFPEQHTSIAIFCNFEGTEASTLSDQVADIVLADVLAAADSPPAQQTDLRQNAEAKSLPPQRFTGRYFAAESDTVFEVTEEKGALTLKIGSTSLQLTPAGPASFAVEGYPATVEFSIKDQEPAHALQFGVESDPATIATRFTSATPDAEALQAYTGTFYSPELDVTWPVIVEEGRLAVRKETQKFISTIDPLEPAMTDTFNGESGFMRFTRDASGRVTGFDLSSSRMRGIRFEPRPRR